jgi:hypothetical protein
MTDQPVAEQVREALAKRDAFLRGERITLPIVMHADHVAWGWLRSLLAELDALKADLEAAVWNLAGCDTYAMGYGLDDAHSPEIARPALESVKRLALRERALRAERDALRRVIEQPDPAVERAFRFGYRAAERAIAIDYPHITVEIDAEAVALAAFQAEREGRT